MGHPFGMKAYDLALREQIVATYLKGLSYAKTATHFGVSISTVRAYIRLHRANRELEPRSHGGGAPQKLGETERETLQRLCEATPSLTLPALVELLYEASGIKVCTATVRRELKKLGIDRVSIPRTVKKEAPQNSNRTTSRPHRVRHRRPVPGPGRDQAYPSDLTDSEWTVLEPLIPSAKPGGRPEEWSKREIVNAILYVLRSGCPWRMLPHDFPPYTTVYDYFRAWRDLGLWETINVALSKRLRVAAGRTEDPTAAIVDSQSAKTTEKGGREAMTAVSV
jgi:transposase